MNQYCAREENQIGIEEMNPARHTFAAGLIALACNGDAQNYLPLARSLRNNLSIAGLMKLAEIADEEEGTR